MKNKLRKILSTCGDLDVSIDRVADDTDLYSVGLTSFSAVKILIAIEDEFRVEIPDELLGRRLFQSLDSLEIAVTGLLPDHQVV